MFCPPSGPPKKVPAHGLKCLKKQKNNIDSFKNHKKFIGNNKSILD